MAGFPRWPVWVLAGCLGVVGSARAEDRRDSTDLPAAILDTAIRDALVAGDIPGAVFVVGRDDRVLYRASLGWRAIEPTREPISPDTVFDLASLTKVVATTPAVLALWEEGRLDLDAPVGRYVPELAGAGWQGVTPRRLLLHTSGLPELTGRLESPLTVAGYLRALARLAPTAAPGETFQYVDSGFIVLGELVRRASGVGLDEFARRRLYEPLGMRSTAFRPPAAWRSRIAPTERVRGQFLRGEVHDPHARMLGGVAGNAGLFATADDLARFCRMLLAGGVLDGRRVLQEATVRLMFEPHSVGEVTRTLGWDMASPYARTLGLFFPAGSIGHTGYTGTALWLDPASHTYLVLLTSRVHPAGQGQIAELRRATSGAIGAALFGSAPPPTLARGAGGPEPAAAPVGEPEAVRTGLDRLVADGFRSLNGRTVALLTNQSGLDVRGRRGIDLVAAAPGVRLRAILVPEHGLDGAADRAIPHGRDPLTGLPVWSLYGSDRRPTPAMLAGVDTVVVDLQDVGVRYYTYLTTLVYLLEEASRRGLRVVVLDRPNPITGRYIEGPLMDPDLRSFTAAHPVPVRTGLTMGEFARLVAGERHLPVALTVVALEGWRRPQWFDQTGLPWVNPSPNIRSPGEALLYAGLGLLEASNVSVGRGTATPFELVGAPWIADPPALADVLSAAGLPGVRFEPVWFTPTTSEYAGQRIGGVRVVVTDRETLRPVRLGLLLGRTLAARYPAYRSAAIQDLLVNRTTIWAFLRGDPMASVWRWLESDEVAFEARRAPYLLYP